MKLENLFNRRREDKAVDEVAEKGAKAAEVQKVPGTEIYRPQGDGPVGRKGIEAGGIIGHDNLERETETDKEVRKAGEGDRFSAEA